MVLASCNGSSERENILSSAQPHPDSICLSLSLSLQHLANLRSEVTLTPNMEKLHPSSAC